MNVLKKNSLNKHKELKAIKELKKWCRLPSPDVNYHRANSILVDFLKDLGYTKLTEAYEKIKRW